MLYDGALIRNLQLFLEHRELNIGHVKHDFLNINIELFLDHVKDLSGVPIDQWRTCYHSIVHLVIDDCAAARNLAGGTHSKAQLRSAQALEALGRIDAAHAEYTAAAKEEDISVRKKVRVRARARVCLCI